MGIFSKRRPRDLDRRTALKGVPSLNEDASFLSDEDNETTTVRLKVPRGGGLFERFRPPIVEKKFELDELGTFIVNLIDGKKSAKDLIDEFEEHFRVNRRESELGVVSFLKLLNQRRIISIVEGEG
ncbi:MAG: PqqD family protein [Planctomycetota bacterium]|nr:PqqD family protein [Planctomycetota bacterium]